MTSQPYLPALPSECGSRLLHGTDRTEQVGQVRVEPVSLHQWIAFVTFAGSVYPACACGFVGSPGLSQDEALAQVCEVGQAWMDSDQRKSLVMSSGTFNGVVRS